MYSQNELWGWLAQQHAINGGAVGNPMSERGLEILREFCEHQDHAQSYWLGMIAGLELMRQQMYTVLEYETDGPRNGKRLTVVPYQALLTESIPWRRRVAESLLGASQVQEQIVKMVLDGMQADRQTLKGLGIAP